MTTVFTIGHSNRSFVELTTMLRRHHVTHLIDVRSYPSSRSCPQFNQATMPSDLSRVDIAYHHIPDLGGRRHNRPADDRNAGWQNRSFRSYAEHTRTESFEKGVRELLTVADRYRSAFMCAEAVPWRCHRSLISNVLTVRGHSVFHIMDHKVIEHELGLWGAAASVDTEGNVTYPRASDVQDSLFAV